MAEQEGMHVAVLGAEGGVGAEDTQTSQKPKDLKCRGVWQLLVGKRQDIFHSGQPRMSCC